MPSGLQALLALLLLLPGFVIARMLNARAQQSDLERIIQALIHSFIIYVIYLGVFGFSLPIDWVPVTSSDHLLHFSIVIYRWRIILLGVLSVGFGCIWGYIKSRDWPMQALRKWGLTERTLRESVWNDVLLTQSGTVQVGLGDGRIAIGTLSRYSDTGEEGSLFLSNAAWVRELDNSLVPIPGPGLLLTKSSDIQFIMFLD